MTLRRALFRPVTLALTALILPLTACVGGEAAPTPARGSSSSKPVTPGRTPMPSPTPSAAPQPVPVVQGDDWLRWPTTPGNWVYRQDDRGSIALYGVDGADALITLRCDRGRNLLYLSRAGQPAAGASMTLRASQGMQSYAALPTAGTPPYAAAQLAPGDSMLDAIAYSRGRFVVAVSGMPPVKLPNWAEAARVIEDCRSGS